MMWLRKSKKGFTLVELMVVVAIIGILALLGLRLFLMQQIRSRNAIVKANTATCHTIIQGNLADTDYSSTTGTGNGTSQENAIAAVHDIRSDLLVYLGTVTVGDGVNSERPAGMQNPHLTGGTNIVVHAVADFGTSALFGGVDYTGSKATLGGAVIVGYDTNINNRFYLLGLDNDGVKLGEVYIAQK